MESSFRVSKATSDASQHPDFRHLLIQGHNGAGELAAPNTHQAFELGWELGTVPEADIRTTKDGVLVAFHDPNFERVLEKADPKFEGKGVADFDWEEIKSLDVGSWKLPKSVGETIPRLSDVFAAMQTDETRLLYLDIKAADLAQLAAEAKSAGVETRLIVASPRYSELQAWKQLVPNGKTMLWMGTWGKEDLSGLDANRKLLRDDQFAAVDIVQLHASLRRSSREIERTDSDPFIPNDGYWREFAAELKGQNVLFQALPWGGTSEAIYWKLLDLGAQSFATDYPTILLDALTKYQPLSTD